MRRAVTTALLAYGIIATSGAHAQVKLDPNDVANEARVISDIPPSAWEGKTGIDTVEGSSKRLIDNAWIESALLEEPKVNRRNIRGGATEVAMNSPLYFDEIVGCQWYGSRLVSLSVPGSGEKQDFIYFNAACSDGKGIAAYMIPAFGLNDAENYPDADWTMYHCQDAGGSPLYKANTITLEDGQFKAKPEHIRGRYVTRKLNANMCGLDPITDKAQILLEVMYSADGTDTYIPDIPSPPPPVIAALIEAHPYLKPAHSGKGENWTPGSDSAVSGTYIQVGQCNYPGSPIGEATVAMPAAGGQFYYLTQAQHQAVMSGNSDIATLCDEDVIVASTVPTPAASQIELTIDQVLDRVITEDSRSWLFWTYNIGSARNGKVERFMDNGDAIVYGEYTFSGSREGWVRVRLNESKVVCLRFWNEGNCRPFKTPPSHGMMRDLIVGAATGASSGGGVGGSNSQENPRICPADAISCNSRPSWLDPW